MTNLRRGFRSREAAEDYQMRASITPAYCPLHPAVRGQIVVTDPVHRAGGVVYVYSYVARTTRGGLRRFYGSYVGA